MEKTPEDKAMEKMKLQFMYKPNTIFYTTILFALKQSWTTSMPTACTNGKFVKYNPDFFLSLTEPERIGLTAHEIMHVALNHMSRRGNRHPLVWNFAADHVINLALIKSGYKLPEGGLWDIRFENMSTEQVYKILWNELAVEKEAGGAGADGLIVPGGTDIEFPGDSTEAQEIEKAVADVVHKAKLTAEVSNSTPGNMPGEMEIALDCIINPKLPWDVLLQNYFSAFAKDDYTWSRPNRRFMPDHYLPTAYSEAVCNIASAVDSSGSVDAEEFAYFIKEHDAIHRSLQPEQMTIIDFDSEIQCIHDVTENTDILRDLKFTGGGGTYIVPVLEWAIKNNPDVMLIFTDGEFNMPDKELWPTCPILWLIHSNTDFKAPFGDVIHYEIGN